MTELDSSIARPSDLFGRALFSASYAFTILGGFIMAGLAAMVVISVFGRYLVSKPIFGDFEMVAFGTAISIFLFLPYCHLQRGNVIVDLFLSWAPGKIQRFCDILGSLALFLIAALISWRMVLGGMDMYEYSEVTYILAIPLWWAFPFGVLGSGLLAVCCLYTATRDLASMFHDQL